MINNISRLQELFIPVNSFFKTNYVKIFSVGVLITVSAIALKIFLSKQLPKKEIVQKELIPQKSVKKEIQKEYAVLYMSITGNPSHLGHMSAIATAIDVLAKRDITVVEAKISLASPYYLGEKVARATYNIAALSQEAREFLLHGAINEAARLNMFKGVPVTYWNDQSRGYADHTLSYVTLAKISKYPVYFVSGDDLCKKMMNWVGTGVERAIVISRNKGEDLKGYQLKNSKYIRMFEKSSYPALESLSSTAIQEGKEQLQPKELQIYFQTAKLLAKS